MIKLSKRLQAIADMVTEGYVTADIGTDHGYIPIYLIQTGKISRALAMDVNPGASGTCQRAYTKGRAGRPDTGEIVRRVRGLETGRGRMRCSGRHGRRTDAAHT